MVKVFHNKNFLDYRRNTPIDTNDLVLVAEVNTCDLEAAFERTNNIDESWAENPDVTFFGDIEQGCRSTSTGDVMELNGERFVVEMAGYTKIS